MSHIGPVSYIYKASAVTDMHTFYFITDICVGKPRGADTINCHWCSAGNIDLQVGSFYRLALYNPREKDMKSKCNWNKKICYIR